MLEIISLVRADVPQLDEGEGERLQRWSSFREPGHGQSKQEWVRRFGLAPRDVDLRASLGPHSSSRVRARLIIVDHGHDDGNMAFAVDTPLQDAPLTPFQKRQLSIGTSLTSPSPIAGV